MRGRVAVDECTCISPDKVSDFSSDGSGEPLQVLSREVTQSDLKFTLVVALRVN